MAPPASLDMALSAHKAGRLAEAEAAYRALLARDPEDADANQLLGVLCQQTGRLEESRQRLEAVLSRAPDLATAHNNLGITLQAMEDVDGAVAAYRRAILLAPAYAEARHNLALLATERRDYELAETELIEALRSHPTMPELHLALGNAQLGAGRFAMALTCYQNLLDLAPEHAIGHNNIGMIFARTGRPHAALARFDRTVALDPSYAEGRWNRARQRLTIGDWAGGWEDFEARRATPKFAKTMYHPPSPIWRGEPIEGKTVLLHAEQGRGDSIQFMRWARLVADRGARAILDVEPDLVALFRSHDPRVEVIARSPAPPPHDLNCALPSLPFAFHADEATLPAPPYLAADPARIAAWAQRLPPADGRRRIGLVWAGNPEFIEDQERSPRLAPFLPLLGLPGCQFFGLQSGAGRKDLEGWTAPENFIDLGGDFTDFADTAAVMAQMDLIICSCTGPAHLAGALGLPLWVALPYVADWRWMRGRTDSPWYPSARLYRQRAPGDWASVAAAMRADLAD